MVGVVTTPTLLLGHPHQERRRRPRCWWGRPPRAASSSGPSVVTLLPTVVQLPAGGGAVVDRAAASWQRRRQELFCRGTTTRRTSSRGVTTRGRPQDAVRKRYRRRWWREADPREVMDEMGVVVATVLVQHRPAPEDPRQVLDSIVCRRWSWWPNLITIVLAGAAIVRIARASPPARIAKNPKIPVDGQYRIASWTRWIGRWSGPPNPSVAVGRRRVLVGGAAENVGELCRRRTTRRRVRVGGAAENVAELCRRRTTRRRVLVGGAAENVAELCRRRTTRRRQELCRTTLYRQRARRTWSWPVGGARGQSQNVVRKW